MPKLPRFGGCHLFLSTDGHAVTLSGPLTGPGGLNKWGGGLLTLAGSNTFTGGTTVWGGGIVLNSTAALQDSTATVNINNGLLFKSNSGAISTFNLGGLAGGGNISLADGNYPVTLQRRRQRQHHDLQRRP